MASAANDYSANLTFPPGDDLVADHRNADRGEFIPRRDKGPLWIVFPFDADPAYRTPVAFGQSVWQLVKLSVNPLI